MSDAKDNKDFKDVKGLEDTIIDPNNVVVFIDASDTKKSLTYNRSVLDVIPVYKMIHDETKEHKFEISNKYYNIIDNIVQVYVNDNIFKISPMDVIVMLDFIHKYMTVKDIYKEFINSRKKLISIIENEFNNKNYQFINTLVTEAEKYTDNSELIKIIDTIMYYLLDSTIKIKIKPVNNNQYIIAYDISSQDYLDSEELEIKYCILTADDLYNIHNRYHYNIFKLLISLSEGFDYI
jgi:hypothetical protein